MRPTRSLLLLMVTVAFALTACRTHDRIWYSHKPWPKTSGLRQAAELPPLTTSPSTGTPAPAPAPGIAPAPAPGMEPLPQP
jgi:hypothetical protein